MVNDIAPKDRDIAMVFQSYALYPRMSVEDNLGFALKMQGVPRKSRVASVARRLGIGEMLARRRGSSLPVSEVVAPTLQRYLDGPL